MTRGIRTYALTFASLAVLGAAACGGVESSPTAPSPPTAPAAAPAAAPAPAPAPTPTPAPAPAPTGPGRLDIAITPNPVPWSNQPIEGCSLANTWQYDQVLSNGGGTRITISDRVDSFDGAQVSTRTGLGIVLAPGAQTSIHTRWCSANAIEHRAQTTFTGSDDAGNRINAAGPAVRLAPR